MLMIREGVGASQQQVARGMLSVPNLSRVESGQREIDIVMMEALLERLGITLDKMELFLTWDEVYPQCMLLQGLWYQKQNQKIAAYEACKEETFNEKIICGCVIFCLII